MDAALNEAQVIQFHTILSSIKQQNCKNHENNSIIYCTIVEMSFQVV